MNKIILMGRLTRDPELYYSQGETPKPVARYSIAVDKKRKRDDGITADFFQLVAFGRAAEFAENYLRQGIKIIVSGTVQTGSYINKESVKIPFFEVVVEEQEFAESKKAGTANSIPAVGEDGFMSIPDGIEDELPFN